MYKYNMVVVGVWLMGFVRSVVKLMVRLRDAAVVVGAAAATCVNCLRIVVAYAAAAPAVC